MSQGQHRRRRTCLASAGIAASLPVITSVAWFVLQAIATKETEDAWEEHIQPWIVNIGKQILTIFNQVITLPAWAVWLFLASVLCGMFLLWRHRAQRPETLFEYDIQDTPVQPLYPTDVLGAFAAYRTGTKTRKEFGRILEDALNARIISIQTARNYAKRARLFILQRGDDTFAVTETEEGNST